MCKPGYFGQFCGAPCPTGSFGPECGGFCFPKCSNITCHHVHGCPEHPRITLQTTISSHPENAVDLAITSTQKFSTKEKPMFVTRKSTTKRTMQGFQITTRDFSANTKKNIMYVTVKPESRNEFQAMLVGVGALISLFLFIIIIQHCKKSTSSIKRNVSRQSSNDIALHNEPSNQGNRRGYNVISERPKNHSYLSFEVQYAEIPDNLELNTQSTSSSQDNYETSQSFYQNSSTTDSNGDTRNGEFGEDRTEQLKTSVDSSNSYLKPIFVPKVQTRSGEELKNVYINVEQE